MTEIIALNKPFSEDQVDLIKRTVAKGATDDELKLFLHHATKTGLDPLSKQIYFQKRKTKNGEQMTIITGIDGYRLTADRTGKYAGNDDPVFDNEENPKKAVVTVYKLVGGVRCPFTASARWDQYYPGDYQGFMWKKMPNLMLGKCAEALALRKAFPAELSGVYVKEEMDQADKDVIEANVVEEKDDMKQKSPPPEKISPPPTPMDRNNLNHIDILKKHLIVKGFTDDWDVEAVVDAMHGKPFTINTVNQTVEFLLKNAETKKK